jgi:hypothetical protein
MSRNGDPVPAHSFACVPLQLFDAVFPVSDAASGISSGSSRRSGYALSGFSFAGVHGIL